MPDLVEELAAQGRSLSPEERVRLQEATEEAWNNEIARRVAAHERVEGKLYDMEEVLAEASRLAP